MHNENRECRVLFLCANFHNPKETARLCDEIESLENSDRARTIVVDNSHEDVGIGQLTELLGNRARVTLLVPPRNLGYLGAARFGLENYLKNNEMLDWVVVTNTDILMPQKDFLNKLFRWYSGDGCPAVLAPKIISKRTRANQNPQILNRPSKQKMKFYTKVFQNYTTFQIYSALSLIRNMVTGFFKPSPSEPDKEVPAKIYAPHGSFFLLHRSYFEKGGSLRHSSFMFGETVMVAETIRRTGQEAVYDPRLLVEHDEHSTTGLFKSRKIVKFQYDAALNSYRDFFQKDIDENS